MKLLIALCLVALVGLSSAQTRQKDCIFIMGECHRKCDEGTHSYVSGCGYVTSEATCENPSPVEDTRGKICDYSACYCDAPTVRDTATGKCVPLDKCSKEKE